MTVALSDVLDFFVTRFAQSPSTFGAQLERLKYGITVPTDPFRAREDAEFRMLRQAELLRCVDDFATKVEFCVLSRRCAPETAGFKVLEKIRKATHLAQGQIALGVLRAYHEWATQSQERGLLAVYQYLGSLAPNAVPAPPKSTEDLLTAFRTGTAKRARSLAAEGYADALLAMQRHVAIWNRKQEA